MPFYRHVTRLASKKAEIHLLRTCTKNHKTSAIWGVAGVASWHCTISGMITYFLLTIMLISGMSAYYPNIILLFL